MAVAGTARSLPAIINKWWYKSMTDMDQNLQNVTLGALLHDIGKLWHRGSQQYVDKKYGHAKFGHDVLQKAGLFRKKS
ncbi:MAG: HDIG domain-containing protein [Negativicutes bacterium]|nr:HDIG domain-containing protein [Negativicutes bacterium]